VSGNDLYAGGWLTVGGIKTNSIGKWNGTDWSALGSGMNNGVYALAASGTNLYAGGEFSTAGDVSANSIAKWDGSAWSALGSGIDGYVFALAVLGTNLYAGGYFYAGGLSAIDIAKWDGNTWSALGSGIGTVYTLAVSGSDLYAGGQFDTAGGVSANYVAKWNGSNWSSLGSGISGYFPYGNVYVHALAVSGSDLYVGGLFTTAGGGSANYIAKWNGSAWSSLGSGMNSGVYALAVSGNDLYAGGDFAIAGGKVSGYAAHAKIGVFLPRLSILRSAGGMVLSWPSDSAGFVLEQTSALANSPGWTTNAANLLDDNTNKSVTVPATKPHQFFRLRKP
jgi:trimeric autotransporter adhesin